MTNNHMDYLEQIALGDVETLRHKEKTYGGSWKKRGGVGAFMMLARKMDRLENIAASAGYDIFSVIEKQGLGGADGELLAEIRDLRGYLLLVEAEMFSRVRSEPTRDTETESVRIYANITGVDLAKNLIEHPAPFGYDAKEDI